MKIKTNVDLEEFFVQVQQCAGEIWFLSKEGDRLNLGSCLSQCIFTAAFLENPVLLSGEIFCENPTDIETLKSYLE